MPITRPEVISGDGRELIVSTVSLTFVPRAANAILQTNERFSVLFKIAHFKATTSCRLRASHVPSAANDHQQRSSSGKCITKRWTLPESLEV